MYCRRRFYYKLRWPIYYCCSFYNSCFNEGWDLLIEDVKDEDEDEYVKDVKDEDVKDYFFFLASDY